MNYQLKNSYNMSHVTRHASLVTLILFLLASTVTLYAQSTNISSGGALYAPPSTEISSKQNNGDTGGALFRATPNSGPLNDRPGDGEGIGQDDSVPISDGLFVLLGCCLIYGVAKFSSKKRQTSFKPFAIFLV